MNMPNKTENQIDSLAELSKKLSKGTDYEIIVSCYIDRVINGLKNLEKIGGKINA